MVFQDSKSGLPLVPCWNSERILRKYVLNFTGEGFLTIETLSGILLELEPNLGKDELQDIIDEVDEDGSGTIDFDGKIIISKNWNITIPYHATLQLNQGFNCLLFLETYFFPKQ